MSSYDLERPMIPSNKTIRAKLRRIRKQVGGASVVAPNRQLAAIVGNEPRAREELVSGILRYIQRITSAAVPETGWIEVDDRIADLFYGRKRIRTTDVKRIVTLNINPIQARDPESRPTASSASLPGIPITPPLPPDENPDEEEEEEYSLVR